MAYRLASGSRGRRIGDSRSGPGTIGYDANPRGLAGTSSNRGLAGTTNTASDIKRKKKDKKDAEKDKVALGAKPPYEEYDPNDHEEVESAGIWLKALVPENYKPELVVIGEGVPGTEGAGWVLSLSIDKSDMPDDVKAKLIKQFKTTEEKFEGALSVLTAPAGSVFHIIDASDKGSIKTPTSPLENGRVKHDHKVIEPKTLRLQGLVSRQDTLAMNAAITVAEVSMSLKTYFTLKSPWRNYRMMYLKSYSSKASSQKYDVFDYTLDLTELLIASDLKDTTDVAELASNTQKGTANKK